MEKQLLNRKIYKDIKRFDRQEMEGFLRNFHLEAFEAGAKSGQQIDFKIELVQVLQATKGIGDKTIEKVLETLKRWEDAKETK